MRYIKAVDVLPKELLEIIQNHIDGEYIYIPRKDDNRKSWGEGTNTREETSRRNSKIYEQYLSGKSVNCLAESYYLSPKSIQKILAKFKPDSL